MRAAGAVLADNTFFPANFTAVDLPLASISATEFSQTQSTAATVGLGLYTLLVCTMYGLGVWQF